MDLLSHLLFVSSVSFCVCWEACFDFLSSGINISDKLLELVFNCSSLSLLAWSELQLSCLSSNRSSGEWWSDGSVQFIEILSNFIVILTEFISELLLLLSFKSLTFFSEADPASSVCNVRFDCSLKTTNNGFFVVESDIWESVLSFCGLGVSGSIIESIHILLVDLFGVIHKTMDSFSHLSLIFSISLFIWR